MFFWPTVYSCWTELFEIELIIYIEMDLALNYLQRLIGHKTNPKQIYLFIQFSVSTVSMSKTVQFQIIQLSISMQFKCN